ncbi:MAG TPA: globin family protein [Herpetosiphonaceae bacterium]|nr:globin family protein [Herpetosiphonaceae bacterium]
MTPDQIALVQSSFAHVVPISDTAATLFYTRLFELDPNLRPLFHTDMPSQGRKLMDMLRVVVSGLNRLDELVPAVQSLGRRHTTYQVENHHYATVGAALLWTLRQGLGESFTAEVEDAWKAAYAVLSATMQAAAAEVVPAA